MLQCGYILYTEEEEVADGGGELAMTVDKKTRKSTDGVHSTGGVSVFTTLGSLILTARPYNGSTRGSKWTGGEEEERGEEEGEDGQGATLQGEIFQTLNKELCLCARVSASVCVIGH